MCEWSTEQLYHWITGASPGARFIWSYARSYSFWFHDFTLEAVGDSWLEKQVQFLIFIYIQIWLQWHSNLLLILFRWSEWRDHTRILTNPNLNEFPSFSAEECFIYSSEEVLNGRYWLLKYSFCLPLSKKMLKWLWAPLRRCMQNNNRNKNQFSRFWRAIGRKLLLYGL